MASTSSILAKEEVSERFASKTEADLILQCTSITGIDPYFYVRSASLVRYCEVFKEMVDIARLSTLNSGGSTDLQSQKDKKLPVVELTEPEISVSAFLSFIHDEIDLENPDQSATLNWTMVPLMWEMAIKYQVAIVLFVTEMWMGWVAVSSRCD